MPTKPSTMIEAVRELDGAAGNYAAVKAVRDFITRDFILQLEAATRCGFADATTFCQGVDGARVEGVTCDRCTLIQDVRGTLPEVSTEFVASYIETALWSSTDESDPSGGSPIDSNYGPDDLDPDTREAMERDCAAFVWRIQGLAGLENHSDKQIAHDFWLTRNGHGAGFWDDDYAETAKDRFPYTTEDLGKKLTDLCKPFGVCNLYISDDDGKIYHSNY